MNPVILIPARMESTRLPGKPLADIGGVPMIVRVARQAAAAHAGDVAVATDSAKIASAVENAGFTAIMTRDDHASGSDRIFEALRILDKDARYDTVINLQGDLPAIEPRDIRAVLTPLDEANADIATLGVEIRDDREKTDPNVVKIVGTPVSRNCLRALYFTRATAPWGEGPLYHHVGIYAYRRPALERFVNLPRSPLEVREALEQLRALEAGMNIYAWLVDTVPVPVDTPDDLARARSIIANHQESRS